MFISKVAALCLLTMAVPSAAVTYVGSFSVSGATGPITSFNGTFRVTFDPTQMIVDDAIPDEFALTIGATQFDPTTTRMDTYIGANATVAGGRDFIFGRHNAHPADSNNGTGGGNPNFAPDFRVRFMLDQNLSYVSARGVYTRPNGGFDTTLDNSVASFSIPWCPSRCIGQCCSLVSR